MSKIRETMLHTLAPIMSLVVPLSLFAVIPFAGPQHIHWKDVAAAQIPFVGRFFSGDTLHLSDFLVTFQVADLNVGILFIFAISSLAIYGTMLGGWSSNNKFSFLGSMRAASQMISYEVGLGLAVIGIVMMYGAVSLSAIVTRQGDLWLGLIPKWGVITQPLGFLLFLACGMVNSLYSGDSKAAQFSDDWCLLIVWHTLEPWTSNRDIHLQ